MTYSRCNKYVLIMNVYNANNILVEPLKGGSRSHILEAYIKQVKHLTNRGYRPRENWMKKETNRSSRNIINRKTKDTSWCPDKIILSIQQSGPLEHGNITLLRAWKS